MSRDCSSTCEAPACKGPGACALGIKHSGVHACADAFCQHWAREWERKGTPDTEAIKEWLRGGCRLKDLPAANQYDIICALVYADEQKRRAIGGLLDAVVIDNFGGRFIGTQWDREIWAAFRAIGLSTETVMKEWVAQRGEDDRVQR